MPSMRFPKILYWLGFLWLLSPATTFGDTLKVLRFFQDGCAAVSPPTAFCEGGDKAGARCTPEPEFDPDNPNFSSDCCVDFDACFTNDPDNACTPTRLRCTAGNEGAACATDADCDTSVCIAGDPFFLGEPCFSNLQCGYFSICTAGDPFMIGEECDFDEECDDFDNGGICSSPTCGDSGDGVCESPSDLADGAVVGRTLNINEDLALMATVTDIAVAPEPSFRKKDRRQAVADIQIVSREDLMSIDPQFCSLAVYLGPLNPTGALVRSVLGTDGP